MCNAKRLKFHQKNKEHRSTVQKVFDSPMSSFFIIDVVVGSVCVAQKFSCSVVIFDGCWIKLIFHLNELVYQGISFGKNMAHPFFVFKFIFVVGYYNELTVVRRKFVIKLSVKDN